MRAFNADFSKIPYPFMVFIEVPIPNKPGKANVCGGSILDANVAH
jgi:hypothetical protein